MSGKSGGSCNAESRSGGSFNEARALCAGSKGQEVSWATSYHASMRPAHYAREVPLLQDEQTGTWYASMRPAHYAREVPRTRRGAAAPRGDASMRPAHYAREVALTHDRIPEASLASMRPAHYAREVIGSLYALACSETASMRPAHYAREVT